MKLRVGQGNLYLAQTNIVLLVIPATPVTVKLKVIRDVKKVISVQSQVMEKVAHQGKMIEKLLQEKGLKTKDLRNASRGRDGQMLTWPAVKKWITAAKLGPGARESAVAALRRLGIDAGKVFDDVVTTDGIDSSGIEHLKPLLRGFDDDELERIATMLRQRPSTQHDLLTFLEGLIFKRVL